MNNNASKYEYKKDMKMMYGALPHYITAGFLGWVISVFIHAIDRQDSINGMLQIGVEAFAFYLFVYTVKLIYSHCENNNLGLLGSHSRMAAAAVMVVLYTLLRVLVKI